ncbi:MAG: demethoxyubiquinone hydroxylase family protein, partial [Gammaproteobacteria bacterium]
MTSIPLKADNAVAALNRAEWLTAALRTDHAGEYGAVCLYQGILRVTRDPVIIEFARKHLETETTHLERIEALLDPKDLTRLLPLWRVAG